MGLGIDTVGAVSATAPVEVAIDIGATAASKATTLNIAVNNSNVEVKDTTGVNVATTATIAASGVSEVKLTDGLALTSLKVTGSGSVDVSEVGLVKVATLTAGDGGVKFNSGDSTATDFTATTGAGKDTLTVDGAVIKSISTGAGDDAVTTSTAALVATASIDLGAGNDTLTLHAAPAAEGATLTGGEGTDTIAMAAAAYTTVSGYSATNLAKITGFDTLSITDVLANGASVDVSKIAGVGSFTTVGVGNGNTAGVTNLGANSTVTIAGNYAGTPATAGTAETATFTFSNIVATAGGASTLAINGVTVTVAAGLTATAADIATAFATGTTTGNAAVSGTQGATYTAAVTAAGTVRYTATAVGDQAVNLAATAGATGTGTAPTAPTPAVVDGTGATTLVVSGTLTTALKTDTASDVMTLVLNNNYTENNDATATVTALTHTVNVGAIETVNVNSTGKASTAFLGATGNKADGVANTLALTDNAIVTMNVTGDQALSFTSASTMTKLATIDASANTGGLTFSGAAADMTSDTASVAMSIKGSATAANNLTGTGRNDTIVGGSKADTITGGLGADTLTGGAGNDVFVFATADGSDSTLVKMDIITDFVANTYGQGVNGAATSAGASAVAAEVLKRTGDVLSINVDGTVTKVSVGVMTSAADAQTYIQNVGNDADAAITGMALDSSSGKLYIDLNSNGTVDSVIQLTGVTTITSAAILLV